MKRLVDLVDRGPRDDLFFPTSANETIFRREFPPFHNAVPDIVEVAYQGNAAWGQRITIPLSREAVGGDLLQWVCVRLLPRSWLGADLETKIKQGSWEYAEPERAWMWANSLGSIAIQQVELEIGDVVVEKWGGEWMDIWSRQWLEGGRAATWDADMYAQIPITDLQSTSRPPWTTVQATEDGYVYCWFPLAFFRRPTMAFPLVSMGPQTQMRLHVTFRPFKDVVRRRKVPRVTPDEVPLGETMTFYDVTGQTLIPYQVKLPTRIPDFEDATVFAGVVHLEDRLRESYLRVPTEMLYEPIHHLKFDVPKKAAQDRSTEYTVSTQFRLEELNGPIREICWVLRRKAAWRFNEWTNYGSLLEDSLIQTVPVFGDTQIPTQLPMLVRARLMVDNAVWRDETERWWRYDYGISHRGGIRMVKGMVYGYAFGEAAFWRMEDVQPAGTVNTSRCTVRLDLEVNPPAAPADAETWCDGPLQESGSEWEVHVFVIGMNWMRFVEGVVGPLFKD